MDEDFEETVTTTHEEIRHLNKAGWGSVKSSVGKGSCQFSVDNLPSTSKKV